MIRNEVMLFALFDEDPARGTKKLHISSHSLSSYTPYSCANSRVPHPGDIFLSLGWETTKAWSKERCPSMRRLRRRVGRNYARHASSLPALIAEIGRAHV